MFRVAYLRKIPPLTSPSLPPRAPCPWTPRAALACRPSPSMAARLSSLLPSPFSCRMPLATLPVTAAKYEAFSVRSLRSDRRPLGPSNSPNIIPKHAPIANRAASERSTDRDSCENAFTRFRQCSSQRFQIVNFKRGKKDDGRRSQRERGRVQIASWEGPQHDSQAEGSRDALQVQRSGPQSRKTVKRAGKCRSLLFPLAAAEVTFLLLKGREKTRGESPSTTRALYTGV